MEIIFILSPVLLYLYLFFIYYKKIIEKYDILNIDKETFIKENVRILIENINKIQKTNKNFSKIKKEYENLFNVEIGMLSEKINKIFKFKKTKFKILSFILTFISLPILIISEKKVNKSITTYLIKNSNIFYKKKNENSKIIVNELFKINYLNKEGKLHRYNKEAVFDIFSIESKYYSNGKLLNEKEFKKLSLKEKINNF